MMIEHPARAAKPPCRPPSRSPAVRWLVHGSLALAALACATGASAQSFLANKKFNPTDVNANSNTTLTFDLFNATDGNLNATLTDTLPTTTPAGQLWFSTTGGSTVTQGSAIGGGCTAGTITYSNFFDAPANTKAGTITITNAVVPPRNAGTTVPNCQVAVPVYAGAVNADANVNNEVPGANATGTNAANQVFPSEDFSATLRIHAPVNALPTTKAFSPALVAGGATSTLTITVRNNTSPAVALSEVTFNDALPGGLTAVGAPTFSASCGAPTTTTTAGETAVQMGGANIAAGATCTVTVSVTAPNTSGPLVNTIAAGEVTASGGYNNAVPATATLNVRSEIMMTKAFGSPDSKTWYTDEAPVPARLYGTNFDFNTGAATASVNQPVPVRVYFSNPTNAELTGGSIKDVLPGNTVSVAGPITGSCGNLNNVAPIAAGLETVLFSGFTVPAAANGAPGVCYVQFYVKTTVVMNPAINALSVAGNDSHVTFTNTNSTTFPNQATSANLITTASGEEGPGVGDGRVQPAKSFITANGASYTGSNPAHVNKGETFWMRVAARNTLYDVDYQNGSIEDTLPAGLKVASPLDVLVMQNPPPPFGDGATVPSGGANDGCAVPGTVTVSDKTITYKTWTLRNAAGPNNTYPRNLGCFYNILLVSDDTAATGGSDSINTVLANNVSATVVGTARTVKATGDVAARVIVRSDLDTSKSFSPSTIGTGAGAVTHLTIKFDNKAATPITGLTVTDPLPSSAGFGTLAVANPANASTTCGGTLTAAPGATSVSLAGGTVPANASCQIEVDVVRTGGTVGDASVTNTIATGAVTNAQGQSNLEPVTATLTKSGAVGINVVKSFAESSALGGRSVPLTLDFAATTGSTGPQDQITLTDNLPAGMLVAPVPNMTTTCQKADGSPADVAIAADRTSFTISGFRFAAYSDGAVPGNRCSVTLSMVLTTTGNKTNTIPAGAITTDVFSTNPSQTLATLSAQPNTALQKQFSPHEVPAGQVSTLTLSIVNVNTQPRTDFSLTDTFPAGMTVAGAAQTTCGNGTLTAVVGSGSVSITGGDVEANATCTITVPVRANTQGTYVNGPSNIDATAYIDKTEGIDELEVGPPPPSPPTPVPVPALGEWNLLMLLAALAGLGGMRLRRRD